MSITNTYDLQVGWDTLDISDNTSEADCDAEFKNNKSISIKTTAALFMSLRKNMNVDISFISAVTGMTKDEVIKFLKGAIYQNPETWNNNIYEGWELASEYISGNLFEKHKAAQAASVLYPDLFSDNVKALESHMTMAVYFDDICLHPGIPFIPPEVIDRFIEHIFGKFISDPLFKGLKAQFLVKRDLITGSWEIPYKNRYSNCVSNFSTYGTIHKSGMVILENILNNKDTIVYKESSNGKKVVDKSATAQVIEKKNAIIKEFDRWVKNTPEIRKIAEKCYLREYGFIRKRVYNGSFLEKKWGEIILRDYQLNSIARILFTMNCMLALPVGRGKTFIILVSALEALRMNLANKIIITPPNNVFVQFEEAARRIDRRDDITFIGTKDFTPSKRQKVLDKIRNAEKGIFVIPQSSFDLIPLSEDHYKREVKEELDKVIEARGKFLNSTPALKRKEKELRETLLKLDGQTSDKNKIYFDNLGINMLYVDEVQAYKNITIDTSCFARGINRKGSAKANKMLDKIHYIQKNNGGKGVVLSTGTPITNSMTDIFVWQKMLQSGELAVSGLNTFDSWAAQFCEKTTEFEIDVDVTNYRLVTRYSKFVNLPELTSLFSSVAEFYTPEETDGLPEFKGYIDVVIPQTIRFRQFLEEISQRCEDVRYGNVLPKDDNMLKITHDGIDGSADIRHIYPDAPFSEHSKVAHCAKKVYEMYVKTNEQKCTQLIFSDISTPKDKFNLYDEMKRLLVEEGIPAEEIAYIHDATNDKKREELFEKTRKGEIRVLIGSTLKLGTGVNVQDKCVALHHLTLPWRPSDMMQREGRILRQGNSNKEIFIFRYVTQGSFDAYSYQILENKQKIICQILKGTVTARNISEVDDSVLSYGEIKALAIGNPLIKERVEAYNELSRYRALRSKSEETRIVLQKQLREIPSLISKENDMIFGCMLDKMFIRKNPPSADADFRKTVRLKIAEKIRNPVSVREEIVIENDYCGFKIIYPAYMTADKPYVYIEKNGRYTVEMGEADIGIMIRIDNAIAKIPEIHESYVRSREALLKKQDDLKAEIQNIRFYNEEISFYNELIEDIDKKLEAA
ncbi:MAG: hypothetical protein IKK63_09205 [Clostridia bacterium]|nr:hypothetical protein [Clostridia bacterium]